MEKSINVYLHSLGYKMEKFDTTNDWGFGGGIGTSYTKDNIEVRVGKAYYRHAPRTTFATVFVDGLRIYDEGTLSVEKFEEILTKVKNT